MFLTTILPLFLLTSISVMPAALPPLWEAEPDPAAPDEVAALLDRVRYARLPARGLRGSLKRLDPATVAHVLEAERERVHVRGIRQLVDDLLDREVIQRLPGHPQRGDPQDPLRPLLRLADDTEVRRRVERAAV